MSRIYYDSSKYYEEKAKLPTPDGIHCIICGKELPPRRRKYCSDECFRNWLKNIKIQNWTQIRHMVLERDNYTCQDCGSRDNLEVHHIKPICEGGDEFDPDNCITLCKNCHRRRHRKTSENLLFYIDKWIDLSQKTLIDYGIMVIKQ